MINLTTEQLRKLADALADDIKDDATDGSVGPVALGIVDTPGNQHIVVYYNAAKKGYRKCTRTGGLPVIWKRTATIVPA